MKNRVGRVGILRSLLNVSTAILNPIDLNYKIIASKYLIKRIVSMNDENYASDFEEITIKIKEFEEDLCKFNRLQLGLETIFQMTGNALLIFYAISLTKTKQGLAAFFEQEAVVFIGITFSSKVIMFLLLGMNFLSFIKVHYSGIAEGYASQYGLFGKVTVLIGIICASVMKVSSCVLYFGPSLGLFNLLHHYQGDYD